MALCIAFSYPSMDELTGKLTTIFHNVNDWLKYAEAKNAVLLAFSGAALTANITLLVTVQNLIDSLRVGLIISASLLCICALICALSFLPKINLEKILWIRSLSSRTMAAQSNDDNFFYFGHLKKYNSDELLNAINSLYLNNRISPPYSKECIDLAEQVTVNSGIAFLKFQLFKYSLYSLITSIAIIPTAILISLVFLRKL